MSTRFTSECKVMTSIICFNTLLPHLHPCCTQSWWWSSSESPWSICYHLGRSESDLHQSNCHEVGRKDDERKLIQEIANIQGLTFYQGHNGTDMEILWVYLYCHNVTLMRSPGRTTPVMQWLKKKKYRSVWFLYLPAIFLTSPVLFTWQDDINSPWDPHPPAVVSPHTFR